MGSQFVKGAQANVSTACSAVSLNGTVWKAP